MLKLLIQEVNSVYYIPTVVITWIYFAIWESDTMWLELKIDSVVLDEDILLYNHFKICWPVTKNNIIIYLSILCLWKLHVCLHIFLLAGFCFSFFVCFVWLVTFIHCLLCLPISHFYNSYCCWLLDTNTISLFLVTYYNSLMRLLKFNGTCSEIMLYWHIWSLFQPIYPR